MNKKAEFTIDCCAIIDLQRRVYRERVFRTLHEHVDELISQGRLVSCREVLREIRAKQDAVKTWADEHKGMFKEPTPGHYAKLGPILDRFQAHADPERSRPYGDPWIIAQAQADGLTIVTSEKNGGPKTQKIPYVCQELKVECCDLLQWFETMGWCF